MDNSRIALVTGGNRGMGLETCSQLAQLGYRVLLGSRDLDSGRQAAASLHSDRVEAVRLDVTSAADITALAQYIEQKHGRLDVLINNAGIMIDGDDGHSPSICAADIERVERSLQEGVDTAIWLATSDEARGSGGYYRKRELIDW